MRVFFKKMGITNLRFKPAYNPYTEVRARAHTHTPPLLSLAMALSALSLPYHLYHLPPSQFLSSVYRFLPSQYFIPFPPLFLFFIHSHLPSSSSFPACVCVSRLVRLVTSPARPDRPHTHIFFNRTRTRTCASPRLASNFDYLLVVVTLPCCRKKRLSPFFRELVRQIMIPIPSTPPSATLRPSHPIKYHLRPNPIKFPQSPVPIASRSRFSRLGRFAFA